jgi:hypothetical protein
VIDRDHRSIARAIPAFARIERACGTDRDNASRDVRGGWRATRAAASRDRLHAFLDDESLFARTDERSCANTLLLRA